jgi:hypothetical protein
MARTGRAWVEIEDQPQRVEDLARGVPVTRLSDAGFVLSHGQEMGLSVI